MGKVIIGIVLILASLWGGAFALDFFKDTVYHFPAYMTALLTFIAGCGFIISSPYAE